MASVQARTFGGLRRESGRAPSIARNCDKPNVAKGRRRGGVEVSTARQAAPQHPTPEQQLAWQDMGSPGGSKAAVATKLDFRKDGEKAGGLNATALLAIGLATWTVRWTVAGPS
jgi:hypothetical protein